MDNTATGWYDDPHGEGQRFWDGTWTHYHRPSEPQPHQGPVQADPATRPNRHAAGLASLFGGLTYVGLLATMLPYLPRDVSYNVGELLVPPVLVSLAVGLMARSSSRAWSWWVYAVIVPVAALLAVTQQFSDLRTYMANEGTRGAEVGLISAPVTGQGWTTLDTPRTRADVDRYVEMMDQQTGTDAVASFVVHESLPGVPVMFMGVNGDLNRNVNSSASENLDSMLAAAKVTNVQPFEAGAIGGAFACGEAAAQGLTWVSCAWVGKERAVFVRWNDMSVTMDRAAELSRELRDLSLT